ncbi:amidohydrolase 2 [Paraphaeosphaeria sporulosa]|uniref:Amidohydrolase 2 n=1 Tax=Paraphaeosphaeria sporulosa TaxID=1460663 RepID=A0A177CD51_9PLEO|nr:amidohydrolase 2 [Paraphaeosphaeria sporulosa]OAG05565.1 amidohydrolase 2 [Paraphaeosphaeria sporulosa]
MAPLSHPIITLEEAFLSPHVPSFYAAQNHPDPHAESGLTGFATPSLFEFGAQRLSSMNDNGISLQIVSHVPSPLPLDVRTAAAVNDDVAAKIAANPAGRFAAFATLPMRYPEDAAKELRRCVRELGFVGALIDSNCGGRFYDDSTFFPVFAAAADLDVPIYIHPCPNEAVKQLLYAGNYSADIATSLSEYAWGWHNDAAVSFLRLFACGIFDRLPALKIVLGHCGEMIPFQMERTANVIERQWPHIGGDHSRTFRAVWNENVWVTTSGFFDTGNMACVLRQCRPDRVMFSVDYPFGKNEAGVAFLNKLLEEGLVDEEGLERIAWKNAEGLLRVKVETW